MAPPTGQLLLTRRTLLKGLAGVAVGAVGGVAAHGFLYERHQVELTEATVGVAGLPEPLRGLRVGLMTDVHRGAWVSAEAVADASKILMAARPDLIVLGGDYVTWGDRKFVNPAAEALAALSAPHGVFAILGNHDDDRDMPAALAKNGIAVLRDARTRLTIRDADLELLGIRFWTKRPADIAKLARGSRGPTVLLAHDPRRMIEAVSLNIPLVLAGHTHGGQVVLPGVGPVAARKFPVVAGVATEKETTMFVSRGVGTVYLPIRVNCPPEVALLTLVPRS